MLDGELGDFTHIVVSLFTTETGETERRLSSSTVLLGEVDGEFVDDLSGVSSEGTEELISGGRSGRHDTVSDGFGRGFKGAVGGLTVPLPSMTMKPNLESLSKSSARASVWNLLSHKYNELRRRNTVSHQRPDTGDILVLFARPAATHVLIGL